MADEGYAAGSPQAQPISGVADGLGHKAAWHEALRSGDWLTRERVRRIALAVLFASAAGITYVLATSDGLNDAAGRPLGTDFSNVYAAGSWVLDGRPDAPFDPAQQLAREQVIFGPATPFYGWHYPPFFLFIAALLALAPYASALALWQATTLGLYLTAMRRVLSAALPAPRVVPDRLWLLLALAYPAVFINLGHGHNGFLTAALLGGGLALLDARPILAGVLFGLLAYKPQFGMMIPLVLIATGRWRCVAAAALTVTALALASTLAFGAGIWSAFLASTEFTRAVVLEQGDTGWHKIQSVFAVLRMWGMPLGLAYAAQGAVILLAGLGLIRLWRSDAAYSDKAAALCIGSLLATPYSLDYDLMALAPAIAFLAVAGYATGFRSYEKSLLAWLWIAPLIARPFAQHTLVPVAVLGMIALLGLLLHRPRRLTA
jgi:hypothetical protein